LCFRLGLALKLRTPLLELKRFEIIGTENLTEPLFDFLKKLNQNPEAIYKFLLRTELAPEPKQIIEVSSPGFR